MTSWPVLLIVECRKATDTRGARWLFGVVALLGVVSCLLSEPASASLEDFVGGAVLPLVAVMPVLAVIISTNDYSTRFAVVTFALVPRRMRVLTARLAATVVVVVATALASALLAVVAFWAVHFPALPSTDIVATSRAVASVSGVALAASLFGAGVGSLIRNTPVAVAITLLVPLSFDITMVLIAPAVAPWVSALAFSAWLSEPTLHMASSPDGAPGISAAAASFGLWTVLPLVTGWWWQSRRDLT